MQDAAAVLVAGAMAEASVGSIRAVAVAGSADSVAAIRVAAERQVIGDGWLE